MKIQCDVCNREEALVFCSADEAVLCHGCDHRVHHANKLAGKHQRFPLLRPSSEDAPCCDVCQEKRALLFCREDRAILCRDCDIPIHTANEFTTKHQRFLLTGAKLSSFPSSSPTTTNTTTDSSACSSFNVKSKPNSVYDSLPLAAQTNSASSNVNMSKVVEDVSASEGASGSTSSLTEYLMEMLPGWQVDELLESSAPFGFCKTDFAPPVHPETNLNLSAEDSGTWVPKVPQAPRFFSNSDVDLYKNQASNLTGNKRMKDVLRVPQISPP